MDEGNHSELDRNVLVWGVTPPLTTHAPIVQIDAAITHLSPETIEAFEIIIVSSQLGTEAIENLLRQAKLSNRHPSVMVVQKAQQEIPAARFYDAGGSRLLTEAESNTEDLTRALHQVSRIRKLQEENTRLVAKLTEANQLLEEKNRRLDEFSATVAHDIRGPLGGVVMKLEYLLDRYKQETDERFAFLMNRALSSTQRLTEIVQAMYEFAKLGADATRMKFVDLEELIRNVITDLNLEDSLNITFGIDALPPVWGSPELLRRLFANLFLNAVKYTDKPEIIVNIGVRRYHQRSLARFVELFVSDNGPGIPLEDRDRIFAIFTRGVSTGKERDGLGVGLSIVRRIAELHYGSVVIDRTSNETTTNGPGATFLITLPTEKIEFSQA